MTSSQVPTQPQRSNDTPTMRIQPVVEPAWPTSEPMTATDLTPVAAVTTKLEPVVVPPAGRGAPGVLPAVPEQSGPTQAGQVQSGPVQAGPMQSATVPPGAPAGFGVPAPGAPTAFLTPVAPPAAPGAPAPGALVPGAPVPGTTALGAPMPGAPMPGAPMPGAVAPGAPAPGVPAPEQATAALPTAPAAPTTPAAPAAPAVPAAKPTAPAQPRSRWRRIARKIVGPTLLTKKG
ncbi:hypothetical protein ACFV4N_00500 [Actinosynnema sp. NPDC059797]